MQIFENLEEQNLFLIRQQQEAESMLERMNLEYNLMVKQFESELRELHTTRNNLEAIANKS